MIPSIIFPKIDFASDSQTVDTNSTGAGLELSYPTAGIPRAAEAYLYVQDISGIHSAHVIHLETKVNSVWSSVGSVTGTGSLRYVGIIDDLRYNVTTAEGSSSSSSVYISAVINL